MSGPVADPAAWRRFLRTLLLAAAGAVLVLYAFVALVDPWDTLPLSPPLPRVPISTNARFSFPALARSSRFDSAVIGTSTSRLLQPARLDPAFAARFVNLAMNSATAWEQSQILRVFLRAHPVPRALIVGLDAAWCGDTADRTTSRPFPEWMYEPDLWPAYRHLLTPYAVQEAANQFAVMVGWHRRRYGLDGYTRFVPDDSAYDPARAAAAIAGWTPADDTPAGGGQFPLPALATLRDTLAQVPAATRVVLYFTPNHVSQQGAPGGRAAARWAACKRAAAGIAAARGATVMDFMVPSAITTDPSNYWDPLHYRESVARRLAASLARGADPDARNVPP